MVNRLITVRLTEATDRQIHELTAAGFGTQSDIIRTAIDRLAEQEIRHMKALTKLICCNCGKIYDNGTADLQEYPLCSTCQDKGITQAQMANRWILRVQVKDPPQSES